MISSRRTPKLKTSDLVENNPSIAYSGAMYPLFEIKPKKKKEPITIIDNLFDCKNVGIERLNVLKSYKK